MNKKGFTLIEILVTTVLLGIVIIVAVPKVTSIFSKSSEKALRLQENEINDAALLYLEDYCINPLSGNICTLSSNNGKYNGTIQLSTLVEKGYIDEVTFNDLDCSGSVTITDNKAETTLTCKD